MNKKANYYGCYNIETEERIICSAIKMNDKIYLGFRHGDCYSVMFEIYSKDEIQDEVHGFLTNWNRFVDRKEGYLIAEKMSQLITNKADVEFDDDSFESMFPEDNSRADCSKILTSEDLW